AEAAAFFRRNPQVYAAFRKIAYQAVIAGKQRCSQRLLWERLRWELYMTGDEADYALNNNYVRYAARRLVDEAGEDLPEGFFQFRERRTPDAEQSTP
ncbi:MAG: hypothetical protein ACO29V_14195, partial [Limnohabitans sp.]